MAKAPTINPFRTIEPPSVIGSSAAKSAKVSEVDLKAATEIFTGHLDKWITAQINQEGIGEEEKAKLEAAKETLDNLSGEQKAEIENFANESARNILMYKLQLEGIAKKDPPTTVIEPMFSQAVQAQAENFISEINTRYALKIDVNIKDSSENLTKKLVDRLNPPPPATKETEVAEAETAAVASEEAKSVEEEIAADTEETISAEEAMSELASAVTSDDIARVKTISKAIISGKTEELKIANENDEVEIKKAISFLADNSENSTNVFVTNFNKFAKQEPEAAKFVRRFYLQQEMNVAGSQLQKAQDKLCAKLNDVEKIVEHNTPVAEALKILSPQAKSLLDLAEGKQVEFMRKESQTLTQIFTNYEQNISKNPAKAREIMLKDLVANVEQGNISKETLENFQGVYEDKLIVPEELKSEKGTKSGNGAVQRVSKEQMKGVVKWGGGILAGIALLGILSPGLAKGVFGSLGGLTNFGITAWREWSSHAQNMMLAQGHVAANQAQATANAE